jgi:hypothetical protein
LSRKETKIERVNEIDKKCWSKKGRKEGRRPSLPDAHFTVDDNLVISFWLLEAILFLTVL